MGCKMDHWTSHYRFCCGWASPLVRHAWVPSYRKNAEAVTERAKSRHANDWHAERRNIHEAQKLKILQNESYRTKTRIMAQTNAKRRLIEDEAYADKNRQQATMNTKRRLMEDEACAADSRQGLTQNAAWWKTMCNVQTKQAAQAPHERSVGML